MDLEVKTRVIKRNGEEVDFRLEKIVNAIKKANEEVENIHRILIGVLLLYFLVHMIDQCKNSVIRCIRLSG